MFEEQVGWWTRQLAGAPQAVELPLDHPRPPVRSARGASASASFGEDLEARLEALSRRLGVTPFMALVAGFATLLYRYGGQTDVVMGTPIANRGRAEVEGLIGFFANTLALRVDLAGNPAFAELAARVREMALGAYAHQDVPFERLVNELRPDRNLSLTPVFQVLLSLQNIPQTRLELAGLTLDRMEVDTGQAPFDLAFFMSPQADGGLRAWVSYARDLLDAETVERLVQHFQRLLEGVVAEGGESARISELPLLAAEERAELMVDRTTADVPRRLVHQLVEAMAAEQPGAVAVSCEGETVSYAELNASANRLAHRLRRLGARPESLVAVCLERSPAMVAALLGVLKAGGAYVPLDPAYPAERIAWVLEDSRASVLITQSSLVDLLPGHAETIVLDRVDLSGESGSDPVRVAGPEDLAYVIYTSGSTGRPKGVAVRQRGAVNFLASMARRPGLDSDDVLLAVTTIAFDISVLELFLPLSRGARVELVDRETLADGFRLRERVEASGATVVQATPATWRVLLEAGWEGSPGLKVLCGGEALPPDLARELLARTRELWNVYGPTETTVWSAVHRVLEVEGSRPIPLGEAVANTQLRLLGRFEHGLELVPPGAPGELYIGGDGLARGYLGRPDLTADRFVPDPHGGRSERGARLYRTGDLVRRRPRDGALEFLGRVDHQVKIRGFRIELGEIEAVLGAHPAVRECAVVVREDVPGNKLLAAYMALQEEAVVDLQALRAALQEKLPEYMVPQSFVVLPALPRTPNGKVDRRALPASDGSRPGTEFVAPRNPTEEALAAVWAEVLHRDGIGVHDNFFELGGDSIRTIQVVARSRKRGLRIAPRHLFQHQTIAELAGVAEIKDTKDFKDEQRAVTLSSLVSLLSLNPEEIEDVYPLSPGQQGMLAVVLLAGPGSEVYFDQSTLNLIGELDTAVWQRAWQRVQDRHPVLRTRFVWERQGEPLQVVHKQVELPWQELDWSAESEGDRKARLDPFLRQDRARGFDLSCPQLMRCALIRWDAETWKMVWSFHHLIVDGWSLSRMFGEAAACYAAFRESREPELEPPGRYRDYIDWLQRQDLDRAETFWRNALAGFDEPTPLPYDGTGRGGESWSSASELAWIPPAESEALSALARRHQLTLNTLFQGAWGAFLARATGRDDVHYGCVVSGRPGEVEAIESMVGFFINVLPARVRVGREAVSTALAALQRSQVEARDFEYCPLERIQEWSGLPRGSRQIETLLVFQNFPVDPLESASLAGLRVVNTGGGAANHYPAVLYVSPRADGLDLSLHFHESRIDAAAARQILTHLRTILAAFVARPESPMAELPLISEEERRELIARAAGPSTEPAGLCIHTLFEAQAARTPNAPAVEAGGSVLSYRELEERAERLAGHLRSRGIGPESIVGLCVERSPEMVIGMLGVLKAGGIYLPLDPAYPQERRALMLEDSGARLVLTQESLSRSDDADPEASTAQPLPENGAYVIYTSGSTGRPKGVLVPHSALVSYVLAAAEDAEIGPGDRVLQFASMSFDTSAEEIYPCLTRGATLVLRDDAMAGPPETFLREIERLRITVLDLPTAYWHELVAGMAEQGLEWPACVRLVILGGEQAQSARLDVWRERVGKRCRLLNTYGPTEATIVATRRDLSGPRDFPAEVPIGRPVPGARVHIVSRGLELLPAGLEGELVIGGAGLARGYLGRPGLTAERFVPDPFADSPGERLYRTGDLARRLPTSELEFRGRADHQVKVRGFRVELGEIEAALRGLSCIRDAAVVLRDDGTGQSRIVAYVVPLGEALAIPELRAGLSERLPDYMLPAAFVTLDALPLTPSGKIDRQALPAPSAERPRLETTERSPVEELIAGIWSDLLGIGHVAGIAPADGFFELGGHSLLAARVLSRVRAVLGVDLSLRSLFDEPTLAGFAARVERARQGDAAPGLPPLVRAPRGGLLPVSFSQQRLWFLDQLEPDSFAYNLAGAVRLEGALDVPALAGALSGNRRPARVAAHRLSGERRPALAGHRGTGSSVPAAPGPRETRRRGQG